VIDYLGLICVVYLLDLVGVIEVMLLKCVFILLFCLVVLGV